MIKLPYGKSFLKLDEEAIKAEVISSKKVEKIHQVEEKLIENLEKSIESPPLRKLISKSKKTLIIVPDKTRAFPFKEIIPPLLRYIEENIELRILIATGLHKPHIKSEIEELLGREVVEKYEVLSHNAEDYSQISKLNKTTKFGTPIEVNKEVLSSDLVIGLGLIEPHFFAGYSGGRKIILPGVASIKAIYSNHSFKMINHPNAKYGVLTGNPIHEDMIEFMKHTKLNYIVNVTINREKEVTGIFCGDPMKAHIEGVKFLDSYVKIPVKKTYDIVITTNGGYPLDRNLYQAVKGMAIGELLVNRRGVIVIASECIDGLGGHEEFYNLFLEANNPLKVYDRIRQNEPIKDQWEAQILARILMKASIIVVSKMKQSIIEEMLMKPASTIQEAISEAIKTVKKKNPSIVIVPEGPYIIPEISSNSN